MKNNDYSDYTLATLVASQKVYRERYRIEGPKNYIVIKLEELHKAISEKVK